MDSDGWCPHCTLLYCTVLYCTVLHCAVLYCTILYCIVLYCTLLDCTLLYCSVLYYTVLSYIKQDITTINYTVLMTVMKENSHPVHSNAHLTKILLYLIELSKICLDNEGLF